MSQRPRIRIRRTGWDYAGEILALFGAVAGTILLIASWADLPEQVPSHFVLSGKPDAWTGRWIVVALVVLTLLVYVGLGLVQRITRYFNYPIRITQQNAPIQYRLARTLVLWLKVTIVWMFVYVEWSTIRVAQGLDSRMHPVPMIAFLVLIFGLLIVYVYRSYKRREETAGDRPYERSY